MEDKLGHERLNGQIEVLDLPLPEPGKHRAPELVLRRTLFIWRPPVCIVPKLPPGYCVALSSDLYRDGIRRFSPADPNDPVESATNELFFDATAFALSASLGGRALVWARDEESANCTLFTYEEARLVLSYARHRQQYLGNTRRLAPVARNRFRDRVYRLTHGFFGFVKATRYLSFSGTIVFRQQHAMQRIAVKLYATASQ
jgi:hypothetical protein